MKKLLSTFLLISLFFFVLTPSVFALTRDQAISQYQAELESIGMSSGDAESKAGKDIDALIASMGSRQSDVDYAFSALEDRVDTLSADDGRKDSAKKALDKAKDEAETFVKMSPDKNIDVQEAVAGSLPRVVAGSDFELAESEALDSVNGVNRILLSPSRPGAVPTGDIVEDFIPQLIRQLFRFAWLGIFIAFTISGVLMIMSHDDEEKITKAKGILYYSLVGFAVIALAFAIVKGVTDIDFFRFI